MRVKTGKGYYTFNYVHEIRWKNGSFTRPGDSGSLVYTAEEREAFGLHFASDGTGFSYCCDLHRVLNSLNVSLIER